MSTTVINTDTPKREEISVPTCLLSTELDFYQAYAWCLDPHPTVRHAIEYLRSETDKLKIALSDW